MKFLVLAVVLLAAVNVFADDEADQAWNEFKLEYSKLFLSKNKEAGRKKTFLQNREKVLELQSKVEAGDLKYVPKLYEHADLSDEEFIERYGGFAHDDSVTPTKRVTYINTRQYTPESFDARDQGWIGPVRNQGKCGSCWTFSSMCCIEAGLAANGRPGYDLSEQLLVDCGKRGGDGCQGGFMATAFTYLSQTGGAVQESQYPYTGLFGTCRMSSVSNGVKVVGPEYLSSDPESIKAALLLKGALAIAVDAGPWRFYGGGVFHSNLFGNPNHAINLVGWGVDSTTGEEYWLIRNSWGTGFGENGYIRVSTQADGGYDTQYTWGVDLGY